MVNHYPKLTKTGFLILCVALGSFAATTCMAIGPDFSEIKETIHNTRTKNKGAIKEKIKSKVHEIISGMPQEVLDAQSNEKVNMPKIDETIEIARQAAHEEAARLIKQDYHNNGKTLRVPAVYKSIGQAIDAAQDGDTVLVEAGIYYEQLVMKDGVKLVSSSAENGDELVTVEGARLRLPRRTLRTIIDGSKATPSKHGMVDFNAGVTRNTIIDGFTICNLPHQNHHTPGHAHGLNVRGASPVIMNCLIRDMGSTGIGNHVVYNDQESPIESRDFRWDNIKNLASAVIYNNIITGSLGLGIGCNHFSSPVILGNEVYANSDAELGDAPSPGMGNKHGSAATIIGNIVHDNPGGGILAQVGKPQGRNNIDRVTHPTIIKNVIYDNGTDRPGIASQKAGAKDSPVIIRNNYVYNSGTTGIALSKSSVGIIEENMVSNAENPAIAVNSSTALQLNHNQVSNTQGTPGIIIVDGGVVYEMLGNAVDSGDSDVPPYLLDGESSIKTSKISKL